MEKPMTTNNQPSNGVDMNYYFRLDEGGRLTLETTKDKSMNECIELTARCIKQLENNMWSNLIHKQHNIGDIAGNYEILERVRRIGRNTKFRVACTLCGATMFRFSNKFNLPHKDCPAISKALKSNRGSNDG